MKLASAATLIGVGLLFSVGMSTSGSAEEFGPDGYVVSKQQPVKLLPGWQKEVPVRDKSILLSLIPFGYVRLGYESVDNDPRYTFIGRNDGFILDHARIGFDATAGEQFSARISLEAASDVSAGTNSPLGQIDVRLRDGYGRYDPVKYIGAQFGQFKAPFAAEELRSTTDELFISEAVGQTGVTAGRGLEQPGLALGRQLGVMISPRRSIKLEDLGLAVKDLGFSYFFMLANGNGDNQLLNDNSDLMFVGRLEARYSNLISIGGAGMTNRRSVGTLPNLYKENDTGYAADAVFTPYNFELSFQYVGINTSFPTVGTSTQHRRAFHVQVGYTFETPWVNITPAYRYAYFNPPLQNDALQYHTFGFRLNQPDFPIAFYVNYTLTGEQAPREVENDWLQLLAQVEF